MTGSGTDPQTILRQLSRVLESPGFARNERLSRFLRFVIERHLAGKDRDLKETVIAIEVFERRPQYNPKEDAIVRVEAGRLRARLDEYYRTTGKDDPVILDLPRGGYVPAFRTRATPTLPGDAPGRKLLCEPSFPLARIACIVGALLVVLAAAWLWVHRQEAVTIAVLPFENLNRDAANDYLADGLTDELIRNLSIIEGLEPRSRTSSFWFKGKPRSLRQAAKQLLVEYIVDGSVLRSGGRLRIDVQLIRTKDDYPLWSGRFDSEGKDVLAVQDEISRKIVNSLRLKLGGRRRYEISGEAYDLCLRARALGFRESVDAYQAAIAKDPTFAPAYAGLASTYAYRTSTVYFNRNDELNKMRAAAEKAIELDPLLAEAFDALGMAQSRDGQWALAGKSFRRAIELDGNRSTSYVDYAVYCLLPLGRVKEALAQMRRAEKADPLSSDVHRFFAEVLLSSHDFDQAAAQCERVLEEPWKSMCLGRARLGQGRMRDAMNVMAAAVDHGVPAGAPIRGYLAYAYARAGRRDMAERIAEADHANPFHQVVAFLGLGDQERALQSLDRMSSQGPMRLGLALACPELDPLQKDARVRRLRAQFGLPG